jgi:hypothetical protein
MTRSECESGIHQIPVYPFQSNTMKKWTSSSRNVTVVLQIMLIAMLMWIHLDLHDNFDISYFLFKKLFRVFLAVYMYGKSQGVVVATNK